MPEEGDYRLMTPLDDMALERYFDRLAQLRVEERRLVDVTFNRALDEGKSIQAAVREALEPYVV